MPNAYGRVFTTANFLPNLAALKAINFGASDPMGSWFVVPNQTTNNVEIWVWEPTSTAATNEIDVIRPDSIVPNAAGRCIQRLKFNASSLGGILAAIAALNTAGLIERTAAGGASTVAVSSFIKTFLDDIDQPTARTTLGLGAASTRAIGTSTGSIRDAADTAYSNARTPTTHASTHAVGGADPVTVFGYLAVSTNSTLTVANQRQLIDVNATAGVVTITLPSAATVGSGWAVQIRKSDATANLVTISRAGSDTINGATTLSLAVQHQSLILFSFGGTSWGVVAGFPGTLPANSLLGTGATAGIAGVIPSSTFALSSALTTKADLVGGVVPSSQLPSYVDDVLEFAALANFPATGETGKIYVALNTNLTYRWSGSAYVEISASLALGTTSATAYRGDFGNTAYTHSQATGNPHNTTASQIGLSNVTNHLQVNTTENQIIGGEKTFSNRVRAFDLMLGNDPYVNTSTNIGKGYITAAPDYYEDYKLGVSGYLRMRCGAGAEFGYSRQFMSVQGSTGNISFSSTTQSTSTTTGALVVSGGAAVGGNLNVGEFTSLGDNVAIKKKYVTGTTGATQGAIVTIDTGITASKIRSVNVLVEYSASSFMSVMFVGQVGYCFSFYAQAGNITVQNINTYSFSSANILSKPIHCIIEYIA